VRYLFSMMFCWAVLVGCSGGGNNDDRPSSNADLRALTLDDAVLDPGFSSGTLSYDAAVTGGTSSTRVTATAADSRARITVDGVAVASGVPSDPIPLPIGATMITVLVTAETGTRQTYSIDVTRLVPSSNANLDDLELSLTELDQIFDPALQAYDASTEFLGSSTRVVATPEDQFATISIDGIPIDAGTPSHYLTLQPGANSVDVLVTAENTRTTKLYSVETSRADFGSLSHRAYVKASNTGPDLFGRRLSLRGDTLATGAPWEQSAATGIGGDQDDNTLNAAGAVYIFSRAGDSWSQTAYVKASNTDDGDRFGWSLAVTDSLAVGAPDEQSLGDPSNNSGTAVGAVYLFTAAAGDSWLEAAYLKASNAESNDRFATALAAEDDIILVGAPFEGSSATGVNGDESNNNLAESGAAYLFIEDLAGIWTQVAYLKASNTDAQDQFGNALAVSNQTLAIGAWLEDSDAIGVDGDQFNTSQADSGAVYLFDVNLTDDWSQSAYLKASNTDNGDGFGSAVAIDGDIVAVSAPFEDSADAGDQQDESLSESGAVYIFRRSTTGQWQQEAYLKASNPGFGDRFGSSLQVLGNLLVVGAPGERSNASGINNNQQDESELDSGAVYLFERSDSGAWNQIAYLKASNTDADDRFGSSLSLDQDTLVIGAPGEASDSTGIDSDQSDNSLSSAGAVYIIR
jgi:hypothetical protein